MRSCSSLVLFPNVSPTRSRYSSCSSGVSSSSVTGAGVITRAGRDSVVIVSLDDYESLRETAYLMRSPANARRLFDAMERLEAGRGESHELVETD